MPERNKNINRTNRIRFTRILICSFFIFISKTAFALPVSDSLILVRNDLNTPATVQNDSGEKNPVEHIEPGIIYVTDPEIIYDPNGNINSRIIVLEKSIKHTNSTKTKKKKTKNSNTKTYKYTGSKIKDCKENYSSKDETSVVYDNTSIKFISGSNSSQYKLKAVKSRLKYYILQKDLISQENSFFYNSNYDLHLVFHNYFTRPPPPRF